MSLARCTFQLEVHEVELFEESEEKEKKIAAQRSVAQSREVLRVGAWARGRSGRPSLRISLREACARFCPWFAKVICSPVTGTCLAELSKPCANLAQTLRCLAVLLHLVGGPLLKEKEKACQRHSNVALIFFSYYTFLESAHLLSVQESSTNAGQFQQKNHKTMHDGHPHPSAQHD